MSDIARWPAAGLSDGMYESFYLRAVSPEEPVSVWIRYTVQKAPGSRPKASIWFTLFDANTEGGPTARKLNDVPVDPADGTSGWIEIGGSSFASDRIEGGFGDVNWSIAVSDVEPELRHLPRGWMYRAPIPKTNPESPVPFGRFSGTVECAGRRYELDRWPGMLGHNWGTEHAWTWVWFNGSGFDGHPDSWIDMALGQVKVAGRLLPWVANGAISVDGTRHRLGGLPRRGVKVGATPGRAAIELPGSGGVMVSATLTAPRESTVAWTYASPGGHRHDVLNCSISKIELDLVGTGSTRHLVSEHGGTYELGLPGRQDWVDLAPFDDDW